MAVVVEGAAGRITTAGLSLGLQAGDQGGLEIGGGRDRDGLVQALAQPRLSRRRLGGDEAPRIFRSAQVMGHEDGRSVGWPALPDRLQQPQRAPILQPDDHLTELSEQVPPAALPVVRPAGGQGGPAAFGHHHRVGLGLQHDHLGLSPAAPVGQERTEIGQQRRPVETGPGPARPTGLGVEAVAQVPGWPSDGGRPGDGDATGAFGPAQPAQERRVQAPGPGQTGQGQPGGGGHRRGSGRCGHGRLSPERGALVGGHGSTADRSGTGSPPAHHDADGTGPGFLLITTLVPRSRGLCGPDPGGKKPVRRLSAGSCPHPGSAGVWGRLPGQRPTVRPAYHAPGPLSRGKSNRCSKFGVGRTPRRRRRPPAARLRGRLRGCPY